MSGLSYSATYTYTVYDDDGCDGDAIAAAATFTTLTPLNWLTVSNESTTATLNMDSQYTHVSWWHTRMGGSAGERCVKASGGSVNLTGLTDKTFYDYVAYYSPVCLNSHIIDRTYFTTTDSGVGNLTSNLDGGCSLGRRNSTTEQSCAAAFTTGTNPDGGYFLHTVTARLEREVGYTGPVVATLHSADADGKPAPQSLATLSGNTKQAAGAYVFSCEGTGVCNLSNDTKYFIVLSAPNAPNYYYRDWQTRNSGQEYLWPTDSGWDIETGALRKSGSDDWTEEASGKMPVFHIAANHTSAGLRAALITSTSASLQISGHTGLWYFKSDKGAHSGSCTSAGDGNRITALNLIAGTYYIYTAYSDSSCATPLASTAFTTMSVTLAVSDVEDDEATLTLSGHTGNWYYKASTGPHTSCSGAQTGTTVNLTGLSSTTAYSYQAYSNSACTEVLATPVTFTTTDVVNATLSSSGVTHNAATLAISGYTGKWWYDASNWASGNCHSAGTNASVDVDHLAASTSYTFKAYDKSGCDSGGEIASKTFTTLASPTLTSSGVTATGATLTIANHSGSWYYKATSGPDTSCSDEQTGTTATITDLTPGTQYTYAAYSDSGCMSANKVATASAFTTGGVSVSNLSQSLNQICSIGSYESFTTRYECAQAFTTGNSAAGYTLHSVTAKMLSDAGSPGDLTVAMHATSGNNPADTAISNATFSGDSPIDAGDYEYTCSGAGCQLSKDTTYFIVLSAPNAPIDANNQHRWRVTNSDNETKVPSSNGMSIANQIFESTGSGGWSSTNFAGVMKVAASVNPVLTATSVTKTTATLSLSDQYGAWSYKYTTPGGGNCVNVAAGTASASLSLTQATEYTFKAYDGSGCTSSKELDSVTFNTLPTLTVSQITDTTATLTLTGNTASWYYKADAGPDSSCLSTALSASTTTEDLTGLTAGTTYTYTAYSDATCTTTVAAAKAFTTSGITVSNLSETATSGGCVVGNVANSGNKKCGASFTTGTSANGYTLNSIIFDFRAKAGSPAGFTVALHEASGTGNQAIPASNAIDNATLSGGSPDTAGEYTYSCSGSGCDLSASTTYFIVMQMVNPSNGDYHRWKTTLSGNETKVPSTNGWSISNIYRSQVTFGSSSWSGAATMFKVAATAK